MRGASLSKIQQLGGWSSYEMVLRYAHLSDESVTDVVRPFAPGPETYTYWDYTQLRFPRREGMRIDFILASPALASRIVHAEIARDERKSGKGRIGSPSDHAPVLVDIR